MAWPTTTAVQLQPEQIALWAHKLEHDTGIHLGPLQSSLLSSQISLRMQALALEDADSYYARVCEHPPEWQTLLGQLLVKETQFFRNREALAGITAHAQQQKSQGSLGPSFDACSLGCATGEEAYSVAASLHSALGPDSYFSVTGLDICSSALQTARAGIYGKARLQQASEQELARYFEPEAETDNYRVTSALRERVTFVRGNLSNIDTVLAMPMDVIVCLNVLIYFRRWRRRALLNHISRWLKPGGLLIIGSGELPGWQNAELTPVALAGVQAYQRLPHGNRA